MLEPLKVTQKVENTYTFGLVIYGDGFPDFVDFYAVRFLP